MATNDKRSGVALSEKGDPIGDIVAPKEPVIAVVDVAPTVAPPPKVVDRASVFRRVANDLRKLSPEDQAKVLRALTAMYGDG